MTTYKLSWRQLDKLVFKYLDKVLTNLQYHYKDVRVGHSIETWHYHNTDNPTFNLIKMISPTNTHYGTLSISNNLISLVSDLFSIDSDSAGKSITRWCKKRFNINVDNLHQIIIFP